VIKSVAVVELGVNNGSGDGGSCFGIEVWTDTAKTWRPKEASMPQTKSISAYSFRRNTDLWQRHSKTERQTYIASRPLADSAARVQKWVIFGLRSLEVYDICIFVKYGQLTDNGTNYRVSYVLSSDQLQQS